MQNIFDFFICGFLLGFIEILEGFLGEFIYGKEWIEGGVEVLGGILGVGNGNWGFSGIDLEEIGDGIDGKGDLDCGWE